MAQKIPNINCKQYSSNGGCRKKPFKFAFFTFYSNCCEVGGVVCKIKEPYSKPPAPPPPPPKRM